MNIIGIIVKKKNKRELSYAEIKYAVEGYISGDVKDYQMSALLMAICINGMTFEETCNLTDVMLKSGDILDFSDVKGVKIDKHSTGGVGDKVTIALGPIVSSLGVIFPKLSGRGLGHTGGTIDKLEAIPGFNVNMSEEFFHKSIEKIGMVVSAQTKNIVPADKKLYALRDVTGTVDSIPLIASSIMSKKLASGADIISLDVKVGSGAFMKNLDDARLLAETMVKIGKKYNKKVVAFLTNMEEPLGNNIGNSLEVIEAIETLKGNVDNDFSKLVIYFADHIISMAYDISMEEAHKKVMDSISSGKAFNKFKEFVVNQNGDVACILDTNKFKKSKYVVNVVSKEEGYLSTLDAFKIGLISSKLGAGRMSLDDEINHSVGIVLKKKVGDYVKKGDVILELHTDFENNDEHIEDVYNHISYSDKKVEKKLIYDVVM